MNRIQKKSPQNYPNFWFHKAKFEISQKAMKNTELKLP
jgi:hypothetical protein